MGISRLPIYILGMIYGKFYVDKKEMNNIVLKSICFLIGISLLFLIILNVPRKYLFSYGLWWYPFILITPALVVMLSEIFEFFNKNKLNIINSFIEIFGKTSLQIYLVNTITLEFVKGWNSIVISLVFGILLYYLLKLVDLFFANKLGFIKKSS